MRSTKFNSIRISVPPTLVYKTPKTGKEKDVSTLTKTGNLTTREGLKSIVLVQDESITKPIVEMDF